MQLPISTADAACIASINGQPGPGNSISSLSQIPNLIILIWNYCIILLPRCTRLFQLIEIRKVSLAGGWQKKYPASFVTAEGRSYPHHPSPSFLSNVSSHEASSPSPFELSPLTSSQNPSQNPAKGPILPHNSYLSNKRRIFYNGRGTPPCLL